MSRAAIPVDLFNPGQVLACMGFLECAEALRGPAMGGFDWTGEPRFLLEVESDTNPFEAVLTFLARAEIHALAPRGWQPEKTIKDTLATADDFPAREPDKNTLPLRLGHGGKTITLGHWCDGAAPRDPFKLYAGNRSAWKIAHDMLHGLATLLRENPEQLIDDPLNRLAPMRGSFNFDPRGAWNGLDVGYSLNDLKGEQQQSVLSSPVVEILAACGLEHTRPTELSLRAYRYAAWGEWLPPQLARAALGAQLPTLHQRRFRFALELSGKNKVVSFATEEPTP